jgi:hypothetical protein
MADRAGPRLDGRLALGLVLLAGLAAIGIAMAAGAAEGLLQFIATRPPIVRAVLAGAGIVLGGWLLMEAIQRINGSIEHAPGAEGGQIATTDLREMVRAIRLVFLSAASFTAAAGWLLGDPLPLVIALVIAGVDIVETSFLLLVASRRDP